MKKGQPMPEEVRRRISETKRRRAAEQRAIEVDPPLKRCSKCGEYKQRWLDFTTTMRTLADGSLRMHPSSWCKGCQAAKSAAWREQQGQEAMAQRNREYGRARRRRAMRAGRDAGAWETVDVWAFLYWLSEEAYSSLSDLQQRGLRRACDEQGGRISTSFLDRLLVELGAEHMLAQLYPQLYS